MLVCILHRIDNIEKAMTTQLARVQQEIAGHHSSTTKSFEDLGKDLREFGDDVQKKIESYEGYPQVMEEESSTEVQNDDFHETV